MATEDYAIIKSVSDLRDAINDHQEMSVLLLLDVDNTIIRPERDFVENIDRLKALHKASSSEENKSFYEYLISSWRLERKAVLTDPDWPKFIENSVSVFGLTKMDTGQLGLIESTEKWRHKELESLGIKFTHQNPIDEKFYDQPINLNVSDATFFKGIFFCGKSSKGLIVKKILAHGKYDLVVFVDDKIEQLNDVAKACNESSTKNLALHFQMQNVNYDCSPATAIESQILDVILSYYENS